MVKPLPSENKPHDTACEGSWSKEEQSGGLRFVRAGTSLNLVDARRAKRFEWVPWMLKCPMWGQVPK